MFKHLILFALLSVVSSGENVHTNRIVDMSLSNDRVFFTSADKDGKVVIWNHSNLTPIKIFEFGDEATIEKIDLDYNGELHLTGVIYELYNPVFSDGGRKTFGSLKGSKKHGLWIEWYENKQKKNEGAYNDGEKIGKWIYYNKDGSVFKVAEY